MRFALPTDARADSVTGAAALPGGGLVLTLTAPPAGRCRPGAAGRRRWRGLGARPRHRVLGPGSDCADADTAAGQAHLTLPMSVAVWRDRIVVADTMCNSVLQLALP